MRGYRTMAVVGLAGVLAAACSEPSAPAALQPQAGVLQLEGYTGLQPSQAGVAVRWSVEPGTGTFVPPAVLAVPAEVQAGQAFDAVVTTLGMNGCWRADSQAVSKSGRTLDLKPYDVHSGADFCTEALQYLPHTSRVTLDSPGEWTVRVTGRRARHGDREWEVPVAAEATIIVR